MVNCCLASQLKQKLLFPQSNCIAFERQTLLLAFTTSRHTWFRLCCLFASGPIPLSCLLPNAVLSCCYSRLAPSVNGILQTLHKLSRPLCFYPVVLSFSLPFCWSYAMPKACPCFLCCSYPSQHSHCPFCLFCPSPSQNMRLFPLPCSLGWSAIELFAPGGIFKDGLWRVPLYRCPMNTEHTASSLPGSNEVRCVCFHATCSLWFVPCDGCARTEAHNTFLACVISRSE